MQPLVCFFYIHQKISKVCKKIVFFIKIVQKNNSIKLYRHQPVIKIHHNLV